jgi:predicted TIM-barrel fold metal-dependent hydrolase
MSRRSADARRPAPTQRPRRRDVLAGAGAGAAAWTLASCLPRGRRAAAVAPRFEQPIVVDVHCHDFNASDLPITGFIARTLPGLSELSRTVSPFPELILRRVVGTIHGMLNAAAPTADQETALLRSELARADGGVIGPVPPFDVPIGPIQDLADQVARLLGLDRIALREHLLGTAQTLYLVGHGRAQLAASLATNYPRATLFTPLLVDYDAWSDDRPASSLAAQITAHAQVARLAVRGRIGRADARFHPFVAFDPLRDVQGGGALALVREATQRAGFIGVKLYPPVGFLPIGNAALSGGETRAAGAAGAPSASADVARGQALDTALRGLYALCAAEEIPITAHASPSNQFAIGFGELAAPARWAPVLREFPTLRLNFGHFGHETGADGAAGIEAGTAWMHQAAELIEAFPHVYADLSGSPLVYDASYATRFGAHLTALCARFPRLSSRLMYGSDWWLSRFDPGGPAGMVETYETRLESWLGAGARGAIMGRNALRFLGFLDEDDRLARATNRNAERLRAFYGDAPLPPWLG